MKFNKLTPQKVQANLLRIYEQVEPKWHDEGDNWYLLANTHAHSFAVEYDIDHITVCALIAVLSPQKHWFQNLRITSEFLRSKGKKCRHYSMQVNKARLIYNLCKNCKFETKTEQIAYYDAIINGHKTVNFFHNILEPTNSDYCTIDSHMIQLMTGNPHVTCITNKQYDFLVGQLRHFAAIKDECVPVLQAKLWLTFRIIKKQ